VYIGRDSAEEIMRSLVGSGQFSPFFLLWELVWKRSPHLRDARMGSQCRCVAGRWQDPCGDSRPRLSGGAGSPRRGLAFFCFPPCGRFAGERYFRSAWTAEGGCPHMTYFFRSAWWFRYRGNTRSLDYVRLRLTTLGMTIQGGCSHMSNHGGGMPPPLHEQMFFQRALELRGLLVTGRWEWRLASGLARKASTQAQKRVAEARIVPRRSRGPWPATRP